MVMSVNDLLPAKYFELGFEVAKIGDKSLLLTYNKKTVFMFGSYLDVREDFVIKLCDHYLSDRQLKS
jgi:hypothetical protein